MKITNCRVNHIVNPIGFQMEIPVFSYVVEEAEGKKQTAARIVVSTDETGEEIAADTGMTESVNALGEPVRLDLKPRTRYYWRVTVRTDAGEEETGEVNYFETGKRDETWFGKWITCKPAEDENGLERHPVFSKTFTLAGQVRSARLYLSGLGLYEAGLNQKKVSEEKLTPYSNNYNDYIQYQTYDVTGLLEAENSLSVLLGNGWYKGRFGFHSLRSGNGGKGYYGDTFQLIAELHILYEDGSSEIIGSDESWKVTRSNITFSNLYDGEYRDDTLPEAEEEPAELLGDAKCEKLHLVERVSLPVYDQEEIKPAALLNTPAGEKVFDLGQNFAGGFRLRVKEPAGTLIRIQVGEVLQGGNFYRDNLRSAKAEYRYRSNGEEQILEPVFTYYGYRYAKVEGVSNLSKEDFTGIAYYSDITPAGRLETGDAMLNKLLSNISWGQKSNFIDVPTDCPQRDERMGWTADTQVFVKTASYLTDSYAFYRKYLYDLRSEQKERGGMVPNVIPSVGESGTSSVWGDAAAIIPWDLYLFYGDRGILEESIESMKAWVDYIGTVDGTDHGWRRAFHFGDWLALDHPDLRDDQTAGGTEEAYIADVYYMNSARLVEKAAKILGRDADALRYGTLADELLAMIRAEYFTATGRCAITTMTGYVLALYYDLTTDRQKTLEALIRLLKYNGYKIKTGFVGTPLISKVLSSMGEDRLAYEILHNEEYPGWLYEIKLGATTVWERWNSMNPDGSVSSTGMNSFNHYAYGSVGEWMWQTLAGISPSEEEPGFKRAIIRPVADYATGRVKAEYRSPAGTYRVEWEIRDVNTVRLMAEVPFGCTASLKLPYAEEEYRERELTAGVYDITYRTEKPLKPSYSVDTAIQDLLDDPKSALLLQKLIPQIRQLPKEFQKFTFREAAEKFGQPKELLEDLNEELSKL